MKVDNDKESHFRTEGKRLNPNTFSEGEKPNSREHNSPTASPSGSDSATAGDLRGREYPLKGVAQRRGIDLRQKRKLRVKDHIRWISRWVCEEPERTVFLSLTFRRRVSLDRVKLVARRVVRWLSRHLISSWVRSIEYADKRPHIHYLLRLKGSLDAASGLEQIEIKLREHRRSSRLGSVDVRPVHDPAGIADYMVETLRPKNYRSRVKGKVITYSQNIVRASWWLKEARA